ncbi:hypothetical protein METBIDRAFT_44964 [Metschnikowia bicuspidata var. bicuspidata NRRL YB-4993]|uniref:Uncharacterized protein n=1 Tax=Metschnikowia bicuspidata var. bicuspidata NRRL YB-4993 TaxID=869754 RepID=A0A1A0H7Q7_9ASCO|nr:hypothetical protein METBIDRAFT_44964 [Metschnikowia bicuspidata var. bicuspidata NRRL YB-4993]OBA19933.1 hypothetical protein METBIDRAFT_44964 [Metschnikowia bicuspidata var. bicuspidata NRRL YB-4993]
MFLFIIVVAVVLCVIILYLPYAAGLTTVEKQARKTSEQEKASQTANQYSGYLPPDEELKLQQEAASKGQTSALKNKMKVTSESLPIHIKLNQDGVLRKRTERSVGDLNPNNYDYDLDELIKEETEGEAQRKAQEFYAKQKLGGDKEAMV